MVGVLVEAPGHQALRTPTALHGGVHGTSTHLISDWFVRQPPCKARAPLFVQSQAFSPVEGRAETRSVARLDWLSETDRRGV
jgi:hypothetical protein